MVPKKRNTEGKVAVLTEGATVKKQYQTITKQPGTRKIHVNDIHANLVHPLEYRMNTASNHLQYSLKLKLEVCRECAVANTNQKYLRTVAEERDLNEGEIIYLSSQKKPSHGGSNNCNFLQDSYTKQNWYFFMNTKE